jgi:hypothetical protein
MIKKKGYSMKRLVLGCCLLLSAISNTYAASVTFNFTGTVRSDSLDYANELPGLGVAVGSLITGSVTFDSTVADIASNPAVGIYPMTAPSNFEISVGNILVVQNVFELKISDSPNPNEDGFVINNGNTLNTGEEYFRILLQGINVDNDGLPLAPPDSSLATTALIQLWDGDYTGFSDQWRIQADLTSLTVSSVPLPAAAWLFLSALSGLIVAKRRKT